MNEVNRQNEPPRSGPEIWIRRLKKSESANFQIVSPCFWGFHVHWAGNRTEPCYVDKKSCPGHRRGLPLKWKGYLYVYAMGLKDFQFLEFPPTAAKSLLEHYPRGSSLRGEVVSIQRGAGMAARLRVEVLSDKWPDLAAALPEDKDPLPTLAKLWGLDPSQLNLSGDNEPPDDPRLV